MGAAKLSRRDKAQIALLLGLLALMLVVPSVVLAGLISGRWVGLVLGVPTFPVVALWTKARLRIRAETAIHLGWAGGAVVGMLLRVAPGRQTIVAVAATLIVAGFDAWHSGTRKIRKRYAVDDDMVRPELPESGGGGITLLDLVTLAPPGGLITWAICGWFAGFALGAVTFAIVALRWSPGGRTGSYRRTIGGWVGCAVVGLLLRLVPVAWVLVLLGAMAIDTGIHLVRARKEARAEQALAILAGHPHPTTRRRHPWDRSN